MIAPSPAGRMPPPLPPPQPDRTAHDEAWDLWWDANLTYWGEASNRLGRLVPCQGVEFIASGYVVVCAYEDKSYAWLGCEETEHGDGPWIGGTPNWVGGYRYDFESCGERFTDCLMLPVPDPEDMDSVVETLAQAARQLGALDFTQSV